MLQFKDRPRNSSDGLGEERELGAKWLFEIQKKIKLHFLLKDAVNLSFNGWQGNKYFHILMSTKLIANNSKTWRENALIKQLQALTLKFFKDIDLWIQIKLMLKKKEKIQNDCNALPF